MNDRMKEYFDKIYELYNKKYNLDIPTIKLTGKGNCPNISDERVGWVDAELNCKIKGSYSDFKKGLAKNYWHQLGICDGGFYARVDVESPNKLIFSFCRDGFCCSTFVKKQEITVLDKNKIYEFYVLDKELYISETGISHEDFINRINAINAVKSYSDYVKSSNIEIFLRSDGKPILSPCTEIAKDRGPGFEEKQKEREQEYREREQEYDKSLTLPTIADIIAQSINQFEKGIPLKEQQFSWIFPKKYCTYRNGHQMTNKAPEYFDMKEYMEANKVQYDGSQYIFNGKTIKYKRNFGL